MEALDRSMLSLERRLDVLENRLEERLSRMEGLLLMIAKGDCATLNTT